MAISSPFQSLLLRTNKAWSIGVVALVVTLVITVMGLLGTLPLFHDGLYTAHDIWHQMARAHHYFEVAKAGQFPPYWVSSLAQGYGYPLFFFSYHAPWLIGLPLSYLFSTEVVIKLLFGVSFLLSGFSMYFLGYVIFRQKLPALLSSVLYMWAPFHFLTLYVSAAIGTAFVFSFLPLVFIGLILSKQPGKQTTSIACLSVGCAGIILSHLITFVMFLPFFILGLIYVLIDKTREVSLAKIFMTLVLGGVLSLGISSFYLVPAGYYNKLTVISTQAGFEDVYKGSFVNFSQLIYSPWGFGPIISSAKDGEISLQLGLGQWLVVLMSILVLGLGKVLKSKIPQTNPLTNLLMFCLCSLGLSLFLMTDGSRLLWDLVSKNITIDYPFRLLTIGIFFSSLIGGWLLYAMKSLLTQVSLIGRKFRSIGLGVTFISIVIVILYTNRNYVRVNLYTNEPESLYVAAETTTNTFHEYLPKNAKRELINKAHQPIVASTTNEAHVLSQDSFQNSLQVIVESPTGTTLTFRQFDFPGLSVFLNDRKLLKHTTDESGLIRVEVPSGKNTLVVEFVKTPLIQLSLFVTAVSLVVLIYLVAREIISKAHKSAKILILDPGTQN